MDRVLFPILKEHGYRSSLKIEKRGYYPKGGGKVVFTVEPSEIQRFDLTGGDEIKSIGGISHASNHLKNANVANRQMEAAIEALLKNFEMEPDIDVEYCETLSPGSGVQLWIQTQNYIIGGNSLGEKGKPSEQVGKEAVEDLVRNFQGAVDRYAGDQLLPFLALGGGQIEVSQVTNHCLTNQRIIERFLDVKFDTEGRLVKVS
jgi:RNA 3'-terminal phosphate cyclase (GTP)